MGNWELFSNFALHLAALYKGSDISQTTLTGYFNRMYDLAQGKVEATLFEEADTTEYPLAEVIKRVLNIDYEPAKNGNNDVANGGADVALRNTVGQGGELRGTEPPSDGKQAPGGARTDVSRARASDDSGEGVNVRKTGFQFFSGSMGEMIELAKRSASDFLKKIIAPISTRLRDELKSKGVEIDDEYRHTIDSSAIRHTLKRHGEGNERDGSQLPITEEDFGRIADIIENYDNVEVTTSKRGHTALVYSKTFEDGTTIYVEEKLDNRKQLNAETMWKKKSPTLADANRDNPTLISETGGTSADKDNTISSEEQTDGEKSSLGKRVAVASADVNTNPTEAQKEAGNYKKGHVQVCSM